MRFIFLAMVFLATSVPSLPAQQPDSFDIEDELVEPSWYDSLNPWSEERRLAKRWEAGRDTPELLNLETLVLDEAHSFLLFDPVPERLSRSAAQQWFGIGATFGSAEYDINVPTGEGSATTKPLALVLRRAIELEPGPNTFWTAAKTYEFRLLTDMLDQNGHIGHSHVYFSQGRKWAAPVPWGGTSIGLDLGLYMEGGMIDEDYLFNLRFPDVTTYIEVGGYARVDAYQQIIRDWLSVFGEATFNLGGLAADNDAQTFEDSRYRQRMVVGGGFELRIWADPNLTARVYYALTDIEDELETFIVSSQMYSVTLNF